MYCPKCEGYVRNKPYIDSVFDEQGKQKFTCRACKHEFYYNKNEDKYQIRKEDLLKWSKPNLCIYIINLEKRVRELMDKGE